MDTVTPSSSGDAALVERAASGPVDLGVLAQLAAIDPLTLDGDCRVSLIVAFERAKACLDAAQQQALASVIDATEDTGVEGFLARHEVGAALHLSPNTAYDRTRIAAELTGRLPATLAALAEGRISYWQARSMAEAVRELSDEHAAMVESRVLAHADGRTAAETRRALARAVLAVDPVGAAGRHTKAHKERAVSLQPLPDAMSGLWATMTAPDAAQVWDSLTTRARETQEILRLWGCRPDELPGLDALRVDALVAIVTGRPLPGTGDAPAEPSGCGCGGHGHKTAGVVIDVATLLGLAERPGELPGYGPIPGFLARELASDADWVRWTIDGGTRRLVDVGSRRYRPGKRLARYIAAGHGVCGFPGCNARADRCDLDHIVEFRRGGRTIRVNIGPVCRAHHNAKTHGGWLLSYDDDTGIKTWTSPLGRIYRKPPHEPLPDP
jgi:hypothetical protein